MKEVLVTLLTIFGLSPTPTPSLPPPSELKPDVVLYQPVAEFQSRITAKPFGLYVSPKNSPVSPERFTGYHTGVDIEFTDVSIPVPVVAVADGEIIFSGWARGYGGVVAEKIYYQHQDFVVIYGHLRLDTLTPRGKTVVAGQSLGILGEGYTPDTDNERKHLHFGIVKGSRLNLLGYVQPESELRNWVDPLQFYPLPTPTP